MSCDVVDGNASNFNRLKSNDVIFVYIIQEGISVMQAPTDIFHLPDRIWHLPVVLMVFSYYYSLISSSRTSTERRRQYNNFCNRLIPLENQLHMMQDSERSRGLDHSDNEGEFDFGSDLMHTSYAQPKNVSQIKASSSTSAARHSSVSNDVAWRGWSIMSDSFIILIVKIS